MRKSILALTAAGGVFALTAAAASTIAVTGPFNPRAGSDDLGECDLGAITVETINTDSKISGFQVTVGSNALAEAEGCADAVLYLAVDDADPTNGLKAGVPGTPGTTVATEGAYEWRASVDVSDAFAADVYHVFNYGDIAGWVAPADDPEDNDPYTATPLATEPLIEAHLVGETRVLVSSLMNDADPKVAVAPTTGPWITPLYFDGTA